MRDVRTTRPTSVPRRARRPAWRGPRSSTGPSFPVIAGRPRRRTRIATQRSAGPGAGSAVGGGEPGAETADGVADLGGIEDLEGHVEPGEVAHDGTEVVGAGREDRGAVLARQHPVRRGDAGARRGE